MHFLRAVTRFVKKMSLPANHPPVAADLEQLKGNEESLANRTLRIAVKHADAWLNALNQARLVIAAKNDFSETELNDHLHSPIGSRRDLSLFQVNFYGFLQEYILREMEY